MALWQSAIFLCCTLNVNVCAWGANPFFPGGPVFDPSRWLKTSAKALAALQQVQSLTGARNDFATYAERFDGHVEHRRLAATQDAHEQARQARLAKHMAQSLDAAAVTQLARGTGVEEAHLQRLLLAAHSAQGHLRQLMTAHVALQQGADRAQMSLPDFLRFERERLAMHPIATRAFYVHVADTVESLQKDIGTFARQRQALAETANSDGATRLRALADVAAVELHAIATQSVQWVSVLAHHQLLHGAKRTYQSYAAQQREEALSTQDRVTAEAAWHWWQAQCRVTVGATSRPRGQGADRCAGSTPRVVP
jgi:hypothetical protein